MRSFKQPHFGLRIIFSDFFIDSLRNLGHKFAIITDHKVARLHGDSLLNLLKEAGLDAAIFTFSAGEENKTRQTKERIEDAMQQAHFGRHSCVIAVGGGVVSDLAGFIAATYCRGVSYVVVPTTLLAMVDASIGGKNGVNTPFGKNLIGSFYAPDAIFLDPFFLTTLPDSDRRGGIIEMIKHGIVADEKHFRCLEASDSVENLIQESSTIKLRIVEQDPLESGLRRILNFGHTVGHAIETVSSHQISHGEAVAIGMLIESYLSWKQNLLSNEAFKRIETLIKRYYATIRFPFSCEQILEVMRMDKKGVQGTPRFVMIDDIGSAVCFHGAYCREVPYFNVFTLKEAVAYFRFIL